MREEQFVRCCHYNAATRRRQEALRRIEEPQPLRTAQSRRPLFNAHAHNHSMLSYSMVYINVHSTLYKSIERYHASINPLSFVVDDVHNSGRFRAPGSN